MSSWFVKLWKDRNNIVNTKILLFFVKKNKHKRLRGVVCPGFTSDYTRLVLLATRENPKQVHVLIRSHGIYPSAGLSRSRRKDLFFVSGSSGSYPEQYTVILLPMLGNPDHRRECNRNRRIWFFIMRFSIQLRCGVILLI